MQQRIAENGARKPTSAHSLFLYSKPNKNTIKHNHNTYPLEFAPYIPRHSLRRVSYIFFSYPSSRKNFISASILYYSTHFTPTLTHIHHSTTTHLLSPGPCPRSPINQYNRRQTQQLIPAYPSFRQLHAGLPLGTLVGYSLPPPPPAPILPRLLVQSSNSQPMFYA